MGKGGNKALLKVSQLSSKDVREALIDFQQEYCVFSFEFFKTFSGRYVEHGVGRNWRCDLRVYCSKTDKG